MLPSGASLSGTITSSLHRLKDDSNVDGAFFVYSDLSIKAEGQYRLQFNLYEMRDVLDYRQGEQPKMSREAFYLDSVTTNSFPVYVPKQWAGMGESTQLTRTFSDQGVRLRLRKEPKILLRKRGPASDNYEPRHYNKAQNSAPIRRESQELQPLRIGTNLHSHGVAHGTMQAPGPYDKPPQSQRTFSNTSDVDHSTEQHSSKRPRTSSEQAQSHSYVSSHQRYPAPSSQYPESQQYSSSTQYPEGQSYAHRFSEPGPDLYPTYAPTASQQHNFGTYNQYTQSPQSATTPFQRDFPDYRQDSHNSISPSYNNPSPASYYAPQQTLAGQGIYQGISPTINTQAERISGLNLASPIYPGFNMPPLQEQSTSSGFRSLPMPTTSPEVSGPLHHYGSHY